MQENAKMQKNKTRRLNYKEIKKKAYILDNRELIWSKVRKCNFGLNITLIIIVNNDKYIWEMHCLPWNKTATADLLTEKSITVDERADRVLY